MFAFNGNIQYMHVQNNIKCGRYREICDMWHHILCLYTVHCLLFIFCGCATLLHDGIKSFWNALHSVHVYSVQFIVRSIDAKLILWQYASIVYIQFSMHININYKWCILHIYGAAIGQRKERHKKKKKFSDSLFFQLCLRIISKLLASKRMHNAQHNGIIIDTILVFVSIFKRFWIYWRLISIDCNTKQKSTVNQSMYREQ